MMHTLLTFVPVAALLSITAGAATALVVRNAARGGRRHAFFTTSGNSIGVLAWGCWGRRIERLTGAVLIGLGIRLALERR